MPQQRRRSGLIIGLLALGLLAGAALTAGPAQAVDAVGPYYALPSWDRKMGVVNRFVVLTNWSSAAVLDKETGLVWERSPSGFGNWVAARQHCLTSMTGNHKGWRLPSVHELVSLVDPAHTNPALPTGHPFVVGPSPGVGHVTATANAAVATQVWYVDLNTGAVTDEGFKAESQGYAWCVRGGMNADVY